MRSQAPVRTRFPRSAALVAALLALAMVPGCAEDDGDAPAGSPSESASETVSESPGTAGEVDLLADLVAGEPPQVAYLRGRELVQPDGSGVTLARRYDQFVLLGEDSVAAYDDQGDRQLDVLDAAGRRRREPPARGQLRRRHRGGGGRVGEPGR